MIPGVFFLFVRLEEIYFREDRWFSPCVYLMVGGNFNFELVLCEICFVLVHPVQSV